MINIWKEKKLTPLEKLAKYEALLDEVSESIVELMQDNPYPEKLSKNWAIIWNELQKVRDRLMESDEGEDNLENIKIFGGEKNVGRKR